MHIHISPALYANNRLLVNHEINGQIDVRHMKFQPIYVNVAVYKLEWWSVVGGLILFSVGTGLVSYGLCYWCKKTAPGWLMSMIWN